MILRDFMKKNEFVFISRNSCHYFVYFSFLFRGKSYAIQKNVSTVSISETICAQYNKKYCVIQ